MSNPHRDIQEENESKDSVSQISSVPKKNQDKINPYDLSVVKCAIDDQIIASITYAGEIHQNQFISNIRILFNLIAALSAFYSYFEERVSISTAICLVYIFVTLYNYLVSWFVEKSTIFVSHPNKDQVIRVATYFKETYSPILTIEMETFPTNGGFFSNFTYKHPLALPSNSSNSKIGTSGYYKQVVQLDITSVFTKDGEMEKTSVSNIIDSFLKTVKKSYAKME